MRATVIIENLKCDGCKNALQIKLSKIKGVSNVDINVSKSRVSFDYMTHNVMEGLRAELRDMGYPITEDPAIVSNDKNSNH
ncbi:heavy metal-associated domain-containing protein [Algoriphagus sp. C2-6-M1]|uniref:heavy-metal-associated domain-containing protein n=1 Tax=Algoriphagus persicinus TaxID=3108754 RepID=UPI002B3FA3D5|nr:heavy metal-associated domain-containing protein [Algoriphagus sp. C2-6-M1]MEB2780737.1 heavy metal-associated domain-containing protein [Algoriphagus sp. C2-6-M1]